jgi:hypothetical protein
MQYNGYCIGEAMTLCAASGDTGCDKLAEMEYERCHSYMIKHLWKNGLPRAETDLMTTLWLLLRGNNIKRISSCYTLCIKLFRVVSSAVLLPVNNKAQSVYIAWMQSSPHVYYPQTFCSGLCGSVIWRHRGLYSLFSWRKICRNRVSQ